MRGHGCPKPIINLRYRPRDKLLFPKYQLMWSWHFYFGLSSELGQEAVGVTSPVVMLSWLRSLTVLMSRRPTTDTYAVWPSFLRYSLMSSRGGLNSSIKNGMSLRSCLWFLRIFPEFSICFKSPFAAKISWKKRSSHQGKKGVACFVSKPLVSCMWGCGESVNPPKLNIQEVQGVLSSRPMGDPGPLPNFQDFLLVSNYTPVRSINEKASLYFALNVKQCVKLITQSWKRSLKFVLSWMFNFVSCLKDLLRTHWSSIRIDWD